MNDSEYQYVFKEWITEFSECKELYLVSTICRDYLKIYVETDNKECFEVFFESPGPFRSVDEQHLTNMWEQKKVSGWTFLLENPSWIMDLTLFDLYLPEWQCYVITTYDLCFEVLSEEKPQIKKVPSFPSRLSLRAGRSPKGKI